MEAIVDEIQSKLIVKHDSDQAKCEEKETIEKDATEFKKSPKRDEKYYEDAKKYWAKIPSTVDGMLGGFSSISFIDTRGSANFLKTIFKLKPAPGTEMALDCGAGIGRVTQNLLMNYFDKVDLVEQDANFCREAEKILASEKLGTVFNLGLQDFEPEPKKYDVIWCQWVLGHLTDDDIVEFFFKCTKGLKKNGVIIMKENFTLAEFSIEDKCDSSCTRPLKLMKRLLTKGNLRIIKEFKQNNFPKEIYPVHILATRPIINIS